MTITRVQHADNSGVPYSGNPATLTWGTTPVEGNLLRVIAMERSGNSHTTFSISGTGWTKRIAMDTLIGNASARRTLVIWDKIAGASEPDTVDVSGSATLYVVGEEYNDSAGGTWAFKQSSEADTGTSGTGPLSTGTTASVADGELLAASLGGWRIGQVNNWIGASTSWTNNNGNIAESFPTSNNEIAYSATFGYFTTGGTFENTVDWPDTDAEGNATICVYEAEAAGGTTITVGLASETDTANPVTALKTYPMGLATETDTAFAARPVRSHAAGLATESDTAFAVTRAKTIIAGLATETDAALAATVLREYQLGLASETDTAFAATATKGNTVVAGLAQETDTAFAVVPERVYALGLAQESDVAFAVTPERAYALGLASETDAALAATAERARAVGLASEVDEAFAVLARRAYQLGLASETDTALPVVVEQGQTIQVGLALETDTAFGVTRAKSIVVGQALETDTALTVTVVGGEQPEGGVFEGPHLVNVSRLMRSH